MDGIMQLVLYCGEESFSHLTAWVIIRCSGVNVRNLLIKITLATTDIPNPLQQLTEIAVATLLQPFVIHCKTFLNILMEPLCCPAAETGCHLRLDTVPDWTRYPKAIIISRL